MFSHVSAPLSFYTTPMVMADDLPNQQAMDPSPSDPQAIFIHPPFTTFPDSHLYPDGLTYAILAANPDWFLDPRDFVSVILGTSDAIQYPIKLEPPRKRNLKALGADGVTESGDPKFRCTFCRKSYSGENAKSMWRRHVVKRHGIAMSNRRDTRKGGPRGGRRANSAYHSTLFLAVLYRLNSVNEAASSSTVQNDEEGSSGDESQEKSTPLDDAIRTYSASLVPPTSELPKHEPVEPDYIRNARRAEIMQSTGPLPDPVTRNFNRRTAAYVGVAIRQMAKQAYDVKAAIELEEDDPESGAPLPFEAAMVRQSQQPDHELVTTRKGSIWFFDGNIVIDASSTLFRVHRGVLAKNSDVFRDLFLVPQPTAIPSGEIEGCAVVQMHDSAEDWTYVLNAMYDGRRNTSQALPKFGMVAAFLRLGKKYDIPQLRDEALSVLRSAFSSTLKGFDGRAKNSFWEYDGKYRYFQIIGLARETGTLDLLPMAFYALCENHSPTGLMDQLATAAETGLLSPTDHLTVAVGSNRLAAYLVEDTYHWASASSVGASNCTGDQCTTKAKRAFFQNTFTYNDGSYTALLPWEDIVWVPAEGGDYDGMCDGCMEAAKLMHEQGRLRVWQKLPTAFGLPEWHDLLQPT
ncbi:hypothetical protein HWV62_15323 [Athelia sp. TMB]|nr:hypothetical protein HWV62_15323 [Athelia sp. TMB]